MSYVRVSVLGSMSGGEVWSVNPVFDPTGEFGSTVDQTALDLAAAQIAALSPGSGLLTMMGPLLSITGARLEVRDDASDDLIAISIATRGTALSGTGTTRLPPQAAAVISLRTNTPGGSGRGRLYWPILGAPLTTSARIGAGDVTAIGTNFVTYQNSMRTALAANFATIGFNLAVRSKTTKSTPHVVRLQVGDVVDTQRRRRDNFPEQYTSQVVP